MMSEEMMSADSRVLDGPVHSSRLVHYPICNLRRLSRPAVLFKERRYGEPIWDAGCREHELADRPSIDSGLRGPTRLSRMHCERGSLDLIYTGPVSRLSLGRTANSDDSGASTCDAISLWRLPRLSRKISYRRGDRQCSDGCERDWPPCEAGP